MAIEGGIFSNRTNFQDRFFTDYDKLEKMTESCKQLGLKIVLTSGSYDLLHLGHVKYLERAKSLGDILVVGIDSDAKIRQRKGPGRPVVPESERTELLAHIRAVDIIFLKGTGTEKHKLLKTIMPDVVVVSETTGHEDADIETMKQYCGKVEILKSQAQTSTTAKIRMLFVDGIGKFAEKVTKFIEEQLELMKKGDL